MGSGPSKENHLTLVDAKGVTISSVPQDIIDEISDHLATDPDVTYRSLRSCALILSKPWVPSCQRYLFHTFLLTSRHMTKWLKAFPVPEESPAYFTRVLSFSIQTYSVVHEDEEGVFFGAWTVSVDTVVL